MTILSRPLFRQAGGPIQPPAPMPPMPAAAAARPAMPQSMPAAAAARPAMPAAPVPRPAGQGQGQGPNPAEGVRRLAERETMPLGQRAAQRTMQGIDAAQDPEGLINALRGNEKPIEARYAELAQFVGDQDARATPESVLALVQPALMLTQSGSVDSGIGELMQRLVGDITMEGASGPTPMGQGIGELMGQGAGPEPAGNFSGSAEVPGFEDGGPVDMASLLGGGVKGRVNPVLAREILAQMRRENPTDTEAELGEARRTAQAQALFDIAQGGLALAAGAPGGGSFAQQAAAAFAPVAGSVGKRGAELMATERALKKEARAEDLALRKLAAEMARENAPTRPSLVQVRVGDEVLGTFDVVRPGQMETVQKLLQETPGAQIFTVGTPPVAPQLSETERSREFLIKNLDAYKEGKLSARDTAQYNAILAAALPNSRDVLLTETGEGGRLRLVSRMGLPFGQEVLDAVSERINRGLSVPPTFMVGVTAGMRPAAPAAAAPAAPAPAPAPAAAAAAAPAPARTAATSTGAPLGPYAFGTEAYLKNVFGTALGALGIQNPNEAFGTAAAMVKQANSETMNALLSVSSRTGANTNQQIKEIEGLLPTVATFKEGGQQGAKSKVEALLFRIDNEINRIQEGRAAVEAFAATTRIPTQQPGQEIAREFGDLARLRAAQDFWRRVSTQLNTGGANRPTINEAGSALRDFMTQGTSR